MAAFAGAGAPRSALKPITLRRRGRRHLRLRLIPRRWLIGYARLRKLLVLALGFDSRLLINRLLRLIGVHLLPRSAATRR